MARYFFDIEESGHFTRDTTGVESKTRDAVRYAAIDAIRKIAKDALRRRDHGIIAVDVRDEAGALIFQAMFSLEAG